MKQSIRLKLSSTIAAIVLFTVAVISFFSNYFINKNFQVYITNQEAKEAEFISTDLSSQYSKDTDSWNYDYIHAIGMYSLYEGYIIKVYDKHDNLIWDAEAHDMGLCNQIMSEITYRMQDKYPKMEGQLTLKNFQLLQNGETVGSVSVSYYGPFFLSENDFRFLDSLNKVLVIVGTLSMIASILIGIFLARRISRPILKTVDATKKIVEGNYEVRILENNDTKELTMLVNSINHLAASLETLEKLRKQLTEDVAHELRTPLTIVQSHIEAMMEGIWEPTYERLSSCYDEIDRITLLVKDLEQLSKIEDHNNSLEESFISLSKIIDKTLSVFEAEIESKQLKVTVKGEISDVFADENRIRQVIVNLLSNAVKYSNDGANIMFELFETENKVGFTIEDSGKGIPKEELPFIFERFYRADKSRNRMTGGTGIGLTIVKSIINAHGGSITVESRLNKGSKFTVFLPKQ